MVFLIVSSSTNAQSLSVTLVPSDYNGYPVSCFGGADGEIEAVVTGGTTPYSYVWLHGDSTAVVTDLAAGYYRVTVTDADSVSRTVDITLTQPRAITVTLTPYTWPNGYNVSCHHCYNGSIQTAVQYGVAPYSYLWQDAVTTQHRTSIGAGNYQLVVTDDNGCENRPGSLFLSEPADNNWGMAGNAGTDPESHFIGTSDSTDLVFKSNGDEQLRLLADGGLKLQLEEGILGVDEQGGMKSFLFDKPWCFPDESVISPWYLCGNILNENGTHFLGSVNAQPLIFKTDNVERMRIHQNGLVKVGPATGVTNDQFEVHTTMERNGITLVNRREDDNAHTEIRFKKNSDERWALGCDFEGDGGQDFFIWDALSTTKRLEINAQGKVGIGTVPPLNGSIYKLYVADGIATRDVFVTASTTWPDYVFAEDYRLMPLAELRSYLKQHHHLPGIPPAAEVEAQGGVEVGDMQVRLLKALEEQALYILQLEERIKALEAQRN